MSELPTVTITELLEAGVHFGHRTSRWNPKMAPYIFGIKDEIHIINLEATIGLIKVAFNAIYETVKRNGKVLFVSTKTQAPEIIAEYAEKCGQYYVNYRWLGGMLTNWDTISQSIKRLENLEKILNNEEEFETYTKKEILDITRQKDKLLKSLGGIRSLGGKPDLIIIIDTNKEHIAIKEAKKLNIPIIAIVDSNSNPDFIDFPVPGNDDAIRSIRLYCQLFSDAVIAGIEASLSNSGVDLGAVTNIDEKGKNIKGITKLKPSQKLSKSNTNFSNVNSTHKEEFEKGLKEETKDND